MLIRPQSIVTNADGMVLHDESHINAFKMLEKEEPGAWAMDQGEHSIQFGLPTVLDKRRITLELINAIPIPDKELPLQDVLEFREKHIRELRELQKAVDKLLETINNSHDIERALLIAKDEIEGACATLITATKTARLRSHLGTFTMTANLNLGPFVGTVGGLLLEGMTCQV